MTFMCKLSKECENVSRCSFESPVFFGQQTMCQGFQSASEVEGGVWIQKYQEITH